MKVNAAAAVFTLRPQDASPLFWKVALVIGIVGMFLTPSSLAANATNVTKVSNATNVTNVTTTVTSGLAYQKQECTSVFWNASLLETGSYNPNATTYNFTCFIQPEGSSKVPTFEVDYYCDGVDRDYANCTCVKASLNGKTCNSCNVCNSRQAQYTDTPELLVKSLSANCDAVFTGGKVCNIDCSKGWNGCGGAQMTPSPTVYVSPKPTSMPTISKSAAVMVARGGATNFIVNAVMGLSGVFLLVAAIVG